MRISFVSIGFEESVDRFGEAASTLWELVLLRGVAVQAWLQQSNALLYLGRCRDSLEVIEKVLALNVTVPTLPRPDSGCARFAGFSAGAVGSGARRTCRRCVTNRRA